MLDFNKYTNPEQVVGYELFIDREGMYYKVKKINSSNSFSHYDWAYEYLTNNSNEEIKENDVLNVLIHKYGFIRYAHRNYSPNPILDLPNPAYFKINITKEQKDSILNLLNYNLEYLTKEQLLQLEDEDNIKHDCLIEHCFNECLSKKIK